MNHLLLNIHEAGNIVSENIRPIRRRGIISVPNHHRANPATDEPQASAHLQSEIERPEIGKILAMSLYKRLQRRSLVILSRLMLLRDHPPRQKVLLLPEA